MNATDKDNFFNAVESLKKYRRADLVDEKGKKFIRKTLYRFAPKRTYFKKKFKR